MFLTTNRVQTFDAAFQSRIHISLDYPELDGKSRKTVWQNFLEQHDIAQQNARERPPKALASAAKAAKGATSASSTDTTDATTEAEAKDTHIKRTLAHEITPKELDKLSHLRMNGRQIKVRPEDHLQTRDTRMLTLPQNILKTAQLLASKRGEGLSYEHIQTVMEVTQHLHNSTQENERTKSSLFS